MSLLTIKSAIAGYSQADMILKGVDFTVNKGEIVGIFGPNGAGKSTMLKLAAGLLTPREGRVELKGENIGGLSPRNIARRGMVFVPQEANVFTSLTVRENLEMGAFLYKGRPRQRIEMMLEKFPDLGRLQHIKARGLSGGQRQVLAMATALLVEPEIMLLDEPTAGLSPIAVLELLQNIRDINKMGITIAIVEQNVAAALKILDRAYILVDGKNAVDGPAAEIASDPEVKRKFLGG
ncbi:ABC transporter ATP-binding protein [Devosia faecipullorum]|uniref:ABC transporter ATP-binding protein n=1 Tax=Devosia faecipullorum TaxID=2755039 RepID=UPI00187B7662|nr:ABC transporter ATP-binding protein [Devosia faecipullorum]MBE7733326.1 ABC transporter ATP-binding protein [Devosia faecipullorum]